MDLSLTHETPSDEWPEIRSARSAGFTLFCRHFLGDFGLASHPGLKPLGYVVYPLPTFAPSPPLATSDTSRQNPIGS